MTNRKQIEMGVGKETKTIVKHTSIYGLGGIIGQFIGFFMLPVYTRYLSPGDYGILELLSITTGIIGIIIAAGITQAVFRFYYEYDDQRERNEVISTGVLTFSVFALVALSLLSLASVQFSSLILGSRKYSMYFVVSFATVWFSTLIRMGMDYLRIREWSTIYLVVSMVNLVVSLSLNIYFVVFAEQGVMGILLSGLISSILFAILLVVPLLAKVGLRFSLAKCRALLEFGAPLIVSDVGRSIANRSDRYFIRAFGTLDATGIYSLGYKFGTIVHSFVTSPFLQIWFPRRMASYKDKDSEQMFSQIFTYFLFVLTFVSLGVSVLIKDVIRIVTTPAFYEAHRIVPLIVFAYIIFSFYYHFSIPLFVNKKSRQIAGIDAVTSVVNLVLNYFLIKRYLLWGAVAATILTFLVRVTLTYVAGVRIHLIKLETTRIAQLFLCAGLMYWLSGMIDFGTPWLNIPCKTLFVFLYAVVLQATGFLHDDEVSALREAWASIQNRMLMRA